MAETELAFCHKSTSGESERRKKACHSDTRLCNMTMTPSGREPESDWNRN